MFDLIVSRWDGLNSFTDGGGYGDYSSGNGLGDGGAGDGFGCSYCRTSCNGDSFPQPAEGALCLI